MGKHVPHISLGGMKYSKSIGFNSPKEILAITNLFMTTKKLEEFDMKLELRSILIVVAYIQLRGATFHSVTNFYLAPDKDSYSLPDKNFYLAEKLEKL